ncbi:hypothetical protein [Arthrobacter mobilis]|uniref:Uncharacterized protein n=1 Tax=Arthrobacter mobilis TaxID=2724944 RepID=A0A7X6K751_9MICC|nr:hypothetical protein [Arthrobacter mobilis]NKX56398.1 hypothetical protein [Arthrobacter mobilis]
MGDVWLETLAGNLIASEQIQKIHVGTRNDTRRLFVNLTANPMREEVADFANRLRYSEKLAPDALKRAQEAEAKAARADLVVALNDARRIADTEKAPHVVSYDHGAGRWRITSLGKKSGITRAMEDT